jgi:hypothetical protein
MNIVTKCSEKGGCDSCIIYSSSDFTRIRFIYLCDKNFYGTRYQVSYKGRAVWLSELVPLECLWA